MRPQRSAGPAAPAAVDLESLTCYFQGGYVPMRDAKVSIMTHAFMYGTAVFEGIRAYWNADQGQLYGLFLREHVERIRHSCRIMMMEPVPAVDELVAIITEVVRRNDFREDVYIRPSFYKSTKAIGVRLHHLDHDLYVVALPFGNYIETEKGVRVMTSSWRRNADEALPARGKIVGGYVNMAFQKSEAELNGFDEAIVLTANGHASGGLRGQPVRRPRRRRAHAAGLRRHPRGDHPQGDDRAVPGRGPAGRGPLDRPLGAVHRRRDLPVRDGRPGLAGDRGRPPGRWLRRGRADRPGHLRALLRRGPRAGCPSSATG